MKRTRRRLTKLRSAIYTTPWAILPEKLEAIREVVEFHDSRAGISRDEIPQHGSHPLLGPSYIPAGGAAAAPDAPKIAVLNLYGTIAQRMNIMMEYSGGTSTEMFGKAFDSAVADSNVAAIVIRVDSPGGAVPGVEELSDKIFAARGKKPIVAFIDPMMCSAATWIATAAESIVATPSALQIGSIGVIFTHYEASKREAEAGDTYTVMRSVPGKAEGSVHEPLTKDYQEHLESLISGIHTKFVSAVARNRKVAASKVESSFGGGRTLTAQEALSVGLIDKIQTFEALLADLGASARSSPPSGARTSAQPQGCVSMNPKIKARLVQAGLVKATGTAEEFQAALDLYFASIGVATPATPEAILAAFEAAAALPVTAPVTVVTTQPAANVTAVVPSLTAMEVMGLVNSAGASIPAEGRIELQRTLVAEVAAGKLNVSQVLDRINATAVAATPTTGATRIQVTADAHDKFHAAARDAVVLHALKSAETPKQIFDINSNSYVDWKPETKGYGLSTPLSIARQCLMMAGVPAAKVMDLAPMQIAKLVMGADPRQQGLGGGFLASSDGPAYNVTGMFSNIFFDAGNVTLRRSFDVARTTFQLWMSRGEDIRDFKPVHRVIAGEFGDPKAIPEDGTFDEVTLADGKESYRLTVWGEVFSRSWQLIVNDSLSAFTDTQTKMGNAMKRKLNRIAYQAVKDNANLADGVALFNGTSIAGGGHNNRTTGALSGYAAYTGAWSTMERKMREQKGLSADSSTLNIAPRHIIYPPALTDPIKTALNSQSLVDSTKGNSGTANIWQGQLNPIVESELGAASGVGGSDTRFLLAADTVDIDTIEYAYLQGMPAPVLEQETAFDRLAMRQRIYFAFGVKPLDFRGLQDHTGA